MIMLNIGDQAPGFSGQNQDEETIALSDFSGKNVVLYFYPRDNTPGCTKEACSFRDNLEALADNNTVVVGVSADSAASHKRFADKYELNFHLLADPDKETIAAYQAWGEKKMYGKTKEGILRITYVIGPDGVIKATFPKVKTATHAEEILAVL